MVENNKQLKYHVISAISEVLSRNNGIMRGESYLVFKPTSLQCLRRLTSTPSPFKPLLSFHSWYYTTQKLLRLPWLFLVWPLVAYLHPLQKLKNYTKKRLLREKLDKETTSSLKNILTLRTPSSRLPRLSLQFYFPLRDVFNFLLNVSSWISHSSSN